MPKERIRCAHSAELHVEVRWHPDNGEGAGHVQLATVQSVTPQATMTVHNPIPGTMTTAGSTTVPDQLSGWFVDLDREQLNRMIRAGSLR